MLELALEAKSGRLVQVVELQGIDTDIYKNKFIDVISTTIPYNLNLIKVYFKT